MPYESVSEHCRKTGEQNCHLCENADCNDNTTPSIARLKSDLADARSERAEIIMVTKDATSDKFSAASSVIIRRLMQDAKIDKEMRWRAEKQVEEIADQCQEFGRKLEAIERVVLEALVTFGGKTVPLKEMVAAIKVAKVIGGKDANENLDG